jgi:hypothetical protein
LETQPESGRDDEERDASLAGRGGMSAMTGNGMVLVIALLMIVVAVAMTR